MPVHDFRCPEGHLFEQFQPSDDLREQERCYCGLPATKVFLSAPLVRGDLPGYHSPVTGEWIEGRSARRNDLARHGCVEYEPSLREENARRRREADERLERNIAETVEAEIHNMPARKREQLAAEVQAGAAADIVRLTPTN